MVLSEINSAQAVFTRVASSAQTTSEKGLHKLQFGTMSTVCRVHLHGTSAAATLEFQNDVIRWVAAFEAKYSRFIPDSLIGRINSAAGEHWIELDEETDRLFAFCQQLVFVTRGAFDPTALPFIKLWNWKQQPPVVPADEAIAKARELVGWNKIQRRPRGIFLPRSGMCIDLGGVGKEYAVDCVVRMAVERGIRNILVDFGRDVRVLGHPPDKPHWRIGLEDGRQTGQCWLGVSVTDHAVATSGDDIRSFDANGRRFGHIIDPRTGYPVDNGCRAVTVIAPSCTVAGVLSTAAFILGPQEGVRLIESHPGAEGSITTDQTRLHTRKFHEYAIN